MHMLTLGKLAGILLHEQVESEKARKGSVFQYGYGGLDTSYMGWVDSSELVDFQG